MQSVGPTPTEISQFVVDQVASIIEEAIELTISSNDYISSKINTWIHSIAAMALTNLAKLQKAFKYIVTCVILQVTFPRVFFFSH